MVGGGLGPRGRGLGGWGEGGGGGGRGGEEEPREWDPLQNPPGVVAWMDRGMKRRRAARQMGLASF